MQQEVLDLSVPSALQEVLVLLELQAVLVLLELQASLEHLVFKEHLGLQDRLVLPEQRE